jgi:hypothetical protein
MTVRVSSNFLTVEPGDVFLLWIDIYHSEGIGFDGLTQGPPNIRSLVNLFSQGKVNIILTELNLPACSSVGVILEVYLRSTVVETIRISQD